MVDKQSCKIISIVVTICIALAALDIAWTYWGPCKADVMLMLDDSASITELDFKKVKQFVKKLADDESIKDQMDNENIQFGIATFSKCAKWMGQSGDNPNECDANAAGLKYVHNSYSMNSVLRDYKRMKDNTDVIRALEFVDRQMLDPNAGAKSNSDKMLLFMTDGESTGADYQPQSLPAISKLADKLKEQGVNIYVIAIGKKVDQNEIEAISSSQCTASEEDGKICKNSEKFIIKVDDFDGLDDVISKLASQVCNHQYWMAAIPIVVAILFVVIKLWLDRREARKLEKDANELQNFTPGMASGRV